MALDEELAALFPRGMRAPHGGFNYQGEPVYERADGDWVLSAHHAYEQRRGPIPEGYRVRQTCGNPTCMNPAHMILVRATRRWRQQHGPHQLLPVDRDNVG